MIKKKRIQEKIFNFGIYKLELKGNKFLVLFWICGHWGRVYNLLEKGRRVCKLKLSSSISFIPLHILIIYIFLTQIWFG